MDAERTLDRIEKSGRRNVSGRNVVDLECVPTAAELDLVEGVQSGEFHISVRGERTLVTRREQRQNIIAGVGSDKRRSIIKFDGVVGIERPPVKAEGIFLRSKGDGLVTIAADAQIVGRVPRSR